VCSLPARFQEVGGQRQPFAQWFFPLHATVETDTDKSSEEAAEKVEGLKFYKHIHTEDGEMGEFFTRLDNLLPSGNAAAFGT